MTDLNLVAGWIGILLGFIAGAVTGIFFHDPDWLGGYASWPRRMIRLGHISFFGLGFINIAYALTITNPYPLLIDYSSLGWLFLLIGTVTMPMLCYLSAWRPAFRHLFFIPVLSLIFAVGAPLVSALIASIVFSRGFGPLPFG